MTTQNQVSIPLEQGGVFRQSTSPENQTPEQVSIPLEQGGVFRQDKVKLNQ